MGQLKCAVSKRQNANVEELTGPTLEQSAPAALLPLRLRDEKANPGEAEAKRPQWTSSC